MDATVTSVQEKFPWRLLILLGLLAFPATLAVLPYAMSISEPTLAAQAASTPDVPPETMRMIFWVVNILVSLGQAALLGVPLTALGLLFARWTGLDAPYLRAWVYGRERPAGLGRGLLIGAVTGALAGGAVLAASEWIFGPLMQTSIDAAGISTPDVTWAWWEGLLASFGAAVNEEVALRLFLLNGLAWVGALLIGRRTGRPPLGVLWVANILSTLVFGLIHIPNLMVVGIPIDAATVFVTLAANGLIGILFGWLFWRHGLESAMMAHFSADIVLKVLFLFLV